MMSAGLVFVGGLALADLLLVLLVARRLRQLASRRPGLRERPWLAPGTRVGAFEAVTVGGEPVSLDGLLGQPSLVGFFSASCEPCQEQMPVFAQHVAANGAQQRTLAVIVGPESMAAEYATLLADAAMVVCEERRGPVAAAFSSHAFPGIYRLDPRGRVVASGPSVAAATGDQHEAGSRQ